MLLHFFNRLVSTFYFSVFLLLTGIIFYSCPVYGQLPPTVYRVSEQDSAVDIQVENIALTTASFNDKMGRAFQPSSTRIINIPGDPLLNRRPLTATLWVKVNSSSKFNIFLAHEEKSSPRHWELYTFALTGKLSLYLPGNKAGDTITGGPDLADEKWHYIVMIMRQSDAELFVDGKSVARGKIDRPDTPTPASTLFSIGSLVNGSLPTNGLIDELCISSGTSFAAYSPASSYLPLTANTSTLLLCHFDAKENPVPPKTAKPQVGRSAGGITEEVNRFADVPKYLRASNLPSTTKGDVLSFADVTSLFPDDSFFDVEGTLAAKYKEKITPRTSSFSAQLFPSGGIELTVKKGDKPKRNIPIKTIDQTVFTNRVKQLQLKSFTNTDEFRPGVREHWGEHYVYLEDRLSGKVKLPRGAAEQVYDNNTLVYPDKEKYPVQVVLRQTGALLDWLGFLHRGSDQISSDLPVSLKTTVEDWLYLSKLYLTDKTNNVPASSVNESKKNRDPETDYFIAAALRRRIMFANPELDGLDRILFLARACYAGSRLTNMRNSDRTGGHFATQIYGFNTIQGGGLFALSNWRDKTPKIEDLIAGKTISSNTNHQRLAGRQLDYGSFMSPELGYDGKTLYFSHCGSKEHRWVWTPDTTWNIFKTTIGSKSIEQLTDSAYNDFDVCELPSGRLAFCSERRGGFIRCFHEHARLQVTTSVLHGMKADGTDIYPLSFFETSEWQPSVDNNGMLVYTRWDYTDRENCLGSTFWTCFPDGRNPRSPHGNYPYPWDTFEDNKHGDHRFGSCPDAPSGLPMTEMQFRAIPGTHKYIFTAAPHHGETFGSLCLLDLHVKNDNHMSQIRRLTPWHPFPESEMVDRSQYQYGSPWPLSEDLYLCNSWENLVLLDRFGNEELLCERELLPIGYDPRLRLTDPIPIRPREKPQVIAQQTTQGIDFSNENKTSTIGVVNVNISDRPLPKDRPIKRLRVLQVIPKPNPWMDTPWIGYATENTPRIPLGTVPVEPDGSAFFEAPYGKQLIFQVLDDKNMAVQTMRAVAFTHPGEKLICTGCHEPVDESVANESAPPMAFRRNPSRLEPECGPVEPMNFYRFIKPIFEERCVSCHIEMKKGPGKMGYEDMKPYVYYYSGSMRGGTLRTGPHGGSRARPGRVGASEAKLGKILFDKDHLKTVSEEDRHKIILWLDANALRLGAFQDEKAQINGELVWPLLDTDPCDLYDPGKSTIPTTKTSTY